jgi:hypothetical protein
MDQQFTADRGRNIEEVQQRFERWREGRKGGTPIPAALREDAVCLCADHSLFKISGALRLDRNDETAKERNLSHQERLLFHQRESAPVMKNLKQLF